MTMIERVARALARKDNIYHFDRDSDSGWEQEVERVRATVEAMREPTDLMGNGLPEDYRPGSHSATAIWQAMIDAALSEQQP